MDLFRLLFFNEGVEILDLTDNVSKVSLTVMGADNISGKKYTSSEIENEGFIHQDTILREILVAPMRNVTVYGAPFEYPDTLDNRNIIARIARQLYFASLTLQGKIPYYAEDPLKTKKHLVVLTKHTIFLSGYIYLLTIVSLCARVFIEKIC